MELIVLYILIGGLYGCADYRFIVSHGKKDKFPVYYYMIAGAIWPISISLLAWFI